jgi:hypothetical protein
MDFTSHGCWGGEEDQVDAEKKKKIDGCNGILYRILVNIFTLVVVRQDKETYIAESDVSSGNNLLLPNTADRWQGTTKRKAKLESPATREPYQLWILEYSELSHVEDERETHGNMNNAVRIVIVIIVLMLLCVRRDNSNTSYIEWTFFQMFTANMYDIATRVPESLCQLQLGLNCEYGCRDNLGSGDILLSRSKIFNDSKCEKISGSSLFDMSSMDAHEGDCRSMYATLFNVKNCGQHSKRVLFDMSCTVEYESSGVVNDRFMLKLQIVFKWVQLSTGEYSCR